MMNSFQGNAKSLRRSLRDLVSQTRAFQFPFHLSSERRLSDTDGTQFTGHDGTCTQAKRRQHRSLEAEGVIYESLHEQFKATRA
ncbi:hypothetical protein BaRGS_00001277 [Batillaria attramentaria]|uniref:Uncharacterized protein n=1 Tax=Batillaria attramentaria TaxID=370345 RepID=A0ABD0M7P3_9CAEN